MGCASSGQSPPDGNGSIEPVAPEDAAPDDMVVARETVVAPLCPQRQKALLKEAGFPQGKVVETAHPYEAASTSWQKEVQIDGSTGLSVYFASKNCTLDDETRLTICAGGMQWNAAGPGARVEVEVFGGGVVHGTLTVVQQTEQRWEVLLDRQGSAKGPEAMDSPDGDDLWPVTGNIVEGRYRNGVWYPAKVSDVIFEADWYHATRSPKFFVVTWNDGFPDDREKTIEELRRPKSLRSDRFHVEGLPRAVSRYGAKPNEGGPCVAICAANPKSIWVSYSQAWVSYGGGFDVGDEISRFKIREDSLQPESFKLNGPAQKAGVRTDWLVDIDKTLNQDTDAAPAITKEELLETPDKLLAMTGVTLVLKPMCLERSLLFEGSGPPDLLAVSQLTPLRPREIPSNDVWLTAGAKELKRNCGKFYHEVRLDDICLTPQIGWLTDDFKEADYNNNGVGDDEHGWAADGIRCKQWHGGSKSAKWPKTWQQNDVVGCAIDIEEGSMDFSLNGEWMPNARICFDAAGRFFFPAVSLVGAFTMNITKATWTFAPPDAEYQPWASTGTYHRPLARRWKCPVLPGDSALFEFSTNGNGGDQPDKRWGIWALVLPQDVDGPSREALDALVERWTGSGQAFATN